MSVSLFFKTHSLADEALLVLQDVQNFARSRNHGCIGTEHLLAEICQHPACKGYQALLKLGVDPAALLEGFDKLFKNGPEAIPEEIVIGWTPRMWQVMQYAWILSDREGQETDTRHFLIGLFAIGEGVAAQMLMNLGVTPEKLEEELQN